MLIDRRKFVAGAAGTAGIAALGGTAQAQLP